MGAISRSLATRSQNVFIQQYGERQEKKPTRYEKMSYDFRIDIFLYVHEYDTNVWSSLYYYMRRANRLCSLTWI